MKSAPHLRAGSALLHLTARHRQQGRTLSQFGAPPRAEARRPAPPAGGAHPFALSRLAWFLGLCALLGIFWGTFAWAVLGQ